MALNIPTLKSYALTVEEIQLCLPLDSQFLRFIVRDFARPLKQTFEVDLIDRDRTIKQLETVKFSMDRVKESAVLCILAVTTANVVYVGAIIIDLSQKFQKIKQEISLCTNQQGYVVYSLQDENFPASPSTIPQSSKCESQPPQQPIIAQWKQDQLLLVPQLSRQQSSSTHSNIESIMFNESTVRQVKQNHVGSIKSIGCQHEVNSNNQEIVELRFQVQQLLEQNAQLRHQLQEVQHNCKNQHGQLQQINQKLLSDYQQLLNENNLAKIAYENELNQLRQELQTRTLSTNVDNNQKMEVYLLNQRLKVQMALNNMQAIQIQQTRLEIDSLIEDIERQKQCKTIRINEGIDYRLQLQMMLRINNYLKSQIMSRRLMEHLTTNGTDVSNYRESILTFLSRLKIEQIFSI